MRAYLFFICGQLGLMLQVRYLFQWVVDFTTSQGASVPLFAPEIVGIALFGSRIFDAITDPLAGKISDRIFREGRSRKTLLKKFIPIAPIGLILIFYASPDYSNETNWALFFLGLVLFFTGGTFYSIPYWSLVDELSGQNSNVRHRLSALLGQGLFLATAIGFVCTPFLVHSFGHLHGAIIIATIAIPLCYLPMFANFEVEQALSDDKQAAPDSKNLLERIKEVFQPLKNTPFVAVLFGFIGAQMSFTLYTATLPAFVVHVLGEDTSFVSAVMGPLIILALISFSFVPRLQRKFSLETLLFSSATMIGLLFISLLIVLSYPQENRSLISVIILACVGPPLAVILGIQAHAVSHYAPRRDMVGMYFGSFNFFVKSMNGLALWLSSIANYLYFKSGNSLYIAGSIAAGGALMLLGISLSALILNREQKRNS